MDPLVTKREQALVDSALLVYELWAEHRIRPVDDGASVHLNQFFEALRRYPGWQEAFARGLADWRAVHGQEKDA